MDGDTLARLVKEHPPGSPVAVLIDGKLETVVAVRHQLEDGKIVLLTGQEVYAQVHREPHREIGGFVIESVHAVDNDTWAAKVREIIDRQPASALLSIPGVYELVSEDVNNQAIAELMQEIPEEEL